MTTTEPATRRNSAHPSNWTRTPAETSDFFDEAQLTALRAYIGPLKKVRLADSIVSNIVLLILIFVWDLGPTAAGWIDGPWPVRLVLPLFALLAIGAVLDLPLSWWKTMVHGKRHGMTNHTPGLWAADQVKDLAVGVVTMSLLMIPVYWAVRTFSSWWFVGGLVYLVFAIFMAFVYPVVILPRFNKFTPMPEGPLRTRIEEIAALAGVSIEGVYTVDGSKRSRAGNAYVAGFGPTKRVVVFDTIVDWPLDHVAQIVAHEIGHYRLRHIPRTFPLIALQLPLSLAVVQALTSNETLLEWAGVRDVGEPGAVLLFLLAFTIPTTVLGLVSALVSRHNERQADLEALELLGDPTSFMAMWPHLAALNKADLEPGWWDRLNASHPGIAERMQYADDWAEMNGVPVRRPEPGAVPMDQAGEG